MHPVPRNNPRDSGAVSNGRPDGPGTMGSVAVLLAVINLVIPIIKIPSVHVIHIPVAVVVNAVPRNFIRVHPHRAGQVLMARINPGIDDRHNRVMGAVPIFGPCLLDINIDSRRRVLLPDLHQKPQKLGSMRRSSKGIGVNGINRPLIHLERAVVL